MITTPPFLIEQVIRTVCGHGVDHLARLTSGGLNETYLVTLSHGEPVIVRIARREVPWFTDEADVIAQARNVGIPTPQVLGVEHIEHEGALLSFSVLTVVPGHALADGVGRYAPDVLKRLVVDAGALLARLNTITSDRGMTHTLTVPDEAAIERAVQTARRVAGPTAAHVVARGGRFLIEHLETQSPLDMALAHGDWLPKHIMIHHEEIVGIIDWEFAGPAAPVFEFARWSVSAGVPFDQHINWLREGYGRVANPEVTDGPWMAAYAIGWCLEILGWQNPASANRIRHCVEVISRYVDVG